MDLKVGFNSQLNVSQDLNLAPQMLQWLKLLQVSRQDLSAIVQQELDSNPTLERVEGDPDMPDYDPEPVSDLLDEPREFDGDFEAVQEKMEYLAELDENWRYDDAAMPAGMHDADAQARASEHHEYQMNSLSEGESLQSYLLEQLAYEDYSVDQQRCLAVLIGALDERGYLSVPLSVLSDEISEAELESALPLLQQMDPAGVGARDLSECLVLQLKRKAGQSLAITLAETYLHAVAREQIRDLAELLDTSEEAVEDAVAQIRLCDPTPGLTFEPEAVTYVEPDVTVRRGDAGFVIELAERKLPRLRISASCRELMQKDTLSSSEMSYLRQKMRAASFLIDGISQRQATLTKVVESIVGVQHNFFARNDGELEVLTMASVADQIGVHETTVSRAIANKYIRTPRGVFNMKHFFRSGYRCADGSMMTADRAKSMVAEAIAHEDPSAPLLDKDIAASLSEQGLKMARRTVAKYREELGIPSSKDRKVAKPRLRTGKTDAGHDIAHDPVEHTQEAA